MKNLAILTIAILLSACTQTTTPPSVTITELPDPNVRVICSMEAQICPDGSAVARSGPKCEFAACPEMPAKK